MATVTIHWDIRHQIPVIFQSLGAGQMTRGIETLNRITKGLVLFVAIFLMLLGVLDH